MPDSPPEGVFPFFMADNAAEKYGLKKGKSIEDLIDRKSFNTAAILQEIKVYGFMCGFEPCQQELKECGLEDFVVVCDTTSQYGENFLLLHTRESIENFQSATEIQEKAESEAKQKADEEAKAVEDARLKRLNAVYIEKPFIPRPYQSSSKDVTEKEIEDMTLNVHRPLFSCEISRWTSKPTNLGGGKEEFSCHLGFRPEEIPEFDLKCREKEVAIQAVPTVASLGSQTIWNRKANKAIQYAYLNPSDWGISSQKIWSELGPFLKNVTPLVHQALQENETVDIFADYLHVPSHDDLTSIAKLEDDNLFKEIRNFTDLKYSKGKILNRLDWNPKMRDILAVSVCESTTIEEKVLKSGHTKASHIIVWQFDSQIHPKLVLSAPLECPVFCFNPNMPNIVVAGCMNGQVVLWDLSKAGNWEPSLSPDNETRSFINPGNGHVNGKITRNSVLAPAVLSHPEYGHKRMVADISWLPPEIQINSRGQLLSKEHLTAESNQFFTVSGDGRILFWDCRFEDISKGKLPHIAKSKGSKQAQTQQLEKDPKSAEFPSISWSPLYAIKVKRLEGTGELSFCKVVLPTSVYQNNASLIESKKTQIICSSEEGELIQVDWLPKSSQMDKEESDKNMDRTFSSPEYVQWMTKDHNRPCVALDLSTFFPSFILTVSDWNFHIWHVNNETNRPIFTSPHTSCHLTGGRWSPTRPAVIFISKTDGSVDVWDFTDTCYSPYTTLSLIPNRITSMEFLSIEGKNQMLAVGSSIGSLKVFEVPQNLAWKHPKEMASMKTFFAREAARYGSDGDGIENSNEETGASDSTPADSPEAENRAGAADEVENENITGLSEDEEAAYLEMERTFLDS